MRPYSALEPGGKPCQTRLSTEVDPATREVRAKASPAAMIFIVALVLVRMASSESQLGLLAGLKQVSRRDVRLDESPSQTFGAAVHGLWADTTDCRP